MMDHSFGNAKELSHSSKRSRKKETRTGKGSILDRGRRGREQEAEDPLPGTPFLIIKNRSLGLEEIRRRNQSGKGAPIDLGQLPDSRGRSEAPGRGPIPPGLDDRSLVKLRTPRFRARFVQKLQLDTDNQC